MNSHTQKITSLEDMEREAQSFIDTLDASTSGATLVTLSGELGAGKTTCTQFVAKALEVSDIVNSPTFVIEKIYGVPEHTKAPKKFQRLVHIDAYRLQNAHDLAALGFDEVMSHPRTLVILEWPENVLGVSEQASAKITLEHLSDDSRQIT